jgi:hypothetical protein
VSLESSGSSIDREGHRLDGRGGIDPGKVLPGEAREVRVVYPEGDAALNG